jgi:RNA 2',3'-cyclic 3'-phosphodiesterase
VRLAAPEKLHVTIAFLGTVPEDRVAPLIGKLERAIASLPRCTLRFDALGGFPTDNRARVAWAGARTADGAFLRLAAVVRAAAREVTAVDEKLAVLHVTVARLLEQQKLPPLSFTPHSMEVAAITLFETIPAEATTRYEILKRFDLN